MRTWLRLIVAVAVVSGACAFGAGFVWSAQQARDQAVDRMTFRAERAASSISEAVSTSRSTVEALAGQPGLAQAFDRPDGCTLTAQGMDAFPSVRLDLVSADGRVSCSSDAGVIERGDAVHAGSSWLADVAAGDRTVVSWGSTDAATQQPALVVTSPIISDRTFAGAVTLFLHLPGTAAALAADLVPSDQASVTLVDRAAGTLVASSEPSAARPSTDQVEAWPTTGQWAGIDGSVRLFGSSDVADSDWRVYLGTQRSAVLRAAQGALLREVLVGAVALLALGVSVWVLDRRVVRPLQAITKSVAAASGHPDRERVNADGTAELVILAREFNAMQDVRFGHETQLAHQATHDQLTGLPNRVLLREHLERALHTDTDGAGVAVLFCGLRRFKVVNDGLGHDAGDRLLAAAADRLRTVMRHGDTLARFDGDAFVMVCRDTSTQDAIRIAKRLHHCLAEPFRGIGDGDISLGAAVGIATADGVRPALGRLLREADTAMRQAKDTGRPWSLFDDTLHVRATQRLQGVDELREALSQEQLVVWYQPMHSVATGALIGAEALVRWQHPTRGLLPPGEFIPLAEENGQIAAIGSYVLARACREAAGWAAAGCPIRISVNVAIDQLHDEDFTDNVRRALAESGLPAQLLCLEITESSIMTDIARISDVLAGLRRLGVTVAIDDFGTGYSSLSWLHRLPVDELKIDRSFIARVHNSVSEQHLVKAIVGMAKALHLTVVAEGVETGDQLEVIAGLGSDFAQGYLFDRPMPAQAFTAQLTATQARRSAELVH